MKDRIAIVLMLTPILFLLVRILVSVNDSSGALGLCYVLGATYFLGVGMLFDKEDDDKKV